ncbi:oxygenase MpaB family protein [Actinocorallia aurea]
MSEPGLFKDGDVIRRVTQEGVLLLGGGVASILQTSHPGVGQGVHDHSYTFDDPLLRLRGTMEWLTAVHFGTREEAERVSAFVGKMHDKVNGPGYDAQDPELKVWVGATLFDVSARLYQALFGRLSEAELEEYYQQTRIYAQILGAPADLQPADLKEFKAYYRKMVESFELTPASKEVARLVLHPKAPWYRRPALVAVRLASAGLMPEPLRSAYGWPWSPARERRFLVLINLLRLVYPRLPESVRTAPREMFLASLRHRLAKAEKARPRKRLRSTDPA